MAGPVYYTEDYPKSTRYPDYFNGKLFIYEWIRDWVKVVTMLPNGDFDKMDPFMEGQKLNAVIDMETGPTVKFILWNMVRDGLLKMLTRVCQELITCRAIVLLKQTASLLTGKVVICRLTFLPEYQRKTPKTMI